MAWRTFLLTTTVLLWNLPAVAVDIKLPNRVEVPVTVHVAKGNLLFLWLPSGFNSQRAETPLAAAIAARGIEVWQANVLDARLLPPLESSLAEVPPEDVAFLIDIAVRSGKRVVLVASARSGLLALAGAHHWLSGHPRSKALAGLILLHPNLYTGPPMPGQEAEYHPLVAQNRVPVFIFQPDQSPWRWRLALTRAELETSGAAVYSWLLSDVRDRFYFRPDATEDEAVASRRLADKLKVAAGRLATLPIAAPAAKVVAEKPRTERGSRGLHPYRGDRQTPPLVLETLDGGNIDLRTHRGKVVLVNFWATWCPPCVNEMPSMQRLKEQLAGRPFEILAVNMAEPDREVRAFLKDKVHIDFPVLMDRKGVALKAWKVFVFPTSYVIDAGGQIRLGAFGELEWDSPEILQRLLELMPGE